MPYQRWSAVALRFGEPNQVLPWEANDPQRTSIRKRKAGQDRIPACAIGQQPRIRQNEKKPWSIPRARLCRALGDEANYEGTADRKQSHRQPRGQHNVRSRKDDQQRLTGIIPKPLAGCLPDAKPAGKRHERARFFPTKQKQPVGWN